jgi:hypothetical protein
MGGYRRQIDRHMVHGDNHRQTDTLAVHEDHLTARHAHVAWG